MKEQNKNSAAASELNVVPFKTKALPYMIVAPALIITIGIMIPFVMAIYYSLTNFSFRMPTYSFVGLRNWTQILASKEFLKATWVTIKYAFFSTAIEMGLGMGVAIILNNLNNRFSKIMRVALIFPLMVAPVTATIIWQLMLNNSVGIIEKFLNIFGIVGFPWAASPKTALMTAVMIDVWVNTRNLTLPMLKPSLYIALLFRLMAALQEYAVIFALTKGGPGDTLMNLSLTAYQTGFQFQKFGYALPYILVLWVFINIIAKQIVKRQRAAQKQAAGLEE